MTIFWNTVLIHKGGAVFSAKVYGNRRKKLKGNFSSGLLIFLGNREVPMNYPDNTYSFRQDSHFLYFFGLDMPNLSAVIDVDSGEEILFGKDFALEDVIWMGPQASLKELSTKVDVSQCELPEKLHEYVQQAASQGRAIHFLPPYRSENVQWLGALLNTSADKIKAMASEKFIRAVSGVRSIKSSEEVEEIESALEVTYDMFSFVARAAKPEAYEREIVGGIEEILGRNGRQKAYPIILSVHGEILHNHSHTNQLKKNNLLIVDAGAESPLHYASDVTRTFPVGGVFTPEQRDVYEIVYQTQTQAIDSIKSGVSYKDIHLNAATCIATGLKAMGLMKGDIEEAVKDGAHALFFPHGLGHMMGIDVHDMEDIGEDFVGYDESVSRSKQFGLSYLRLAKKLETGNVLTVEPGIYFIPALIDYWKKEGKFLDYIDYTRVEKFKSFGGIRIEDDVLVTGEGSRVLGKPIPKMLKDIEAAMV